MNAQWFKKRQRDVGITSFDLGEALGRDRTVVSRILNGRQPMTMAQAKVFAELLQVDLETVMRHAGLVTGDSAHWRPTGFSDAEAVPYTPRKSNDESTESLGDRIGAMVVAAMPGVDTWRLNSDLLQAEGYLAGDYLAVDLRDPERAAADDIVIAQVYDHVRGVAKTVIRRFAPPVLTTSHPSAEGREVLVVDRRNVAIRGRVVSSWRV